MELKPTDAQPAPPVEAGADAWSGLRRFTPARIALGRAGGSWRTPSLLDFRLAHAQARDAVLQEFDAAGVENQLQSAGLATVRLTTGARSRAEYLRRPDLGRQLSDESRAQLAAPPSGWADRDLVVLVSDGLASRAAETHAAPVLAELLPQLHAAGWTLTPVFVIPFARVKLQDELGALLRARHALALLGERPGLGSPDSLGAYFTYQPGPGKTDADRNCVSNIRAQGLPPEEAARQLAHLLLASARQQCSGVTLKETTLPRRLASV